MSVGPVVRRMFGPYETNISHAWRSIFVSVDEFVRQIKTWAPGAKQILEVGCGEGAVTGALRVAFPEAEITGIDITSKVGRLFAGDSGSVRFLQCTVQELAAREAGQFDLAVICDVLHHVPSPARQDLLNAVQRTLTTAGNVVFKDWERSCSPIHWLCYTSDRWITGDRVQYMSRSEMFSLFELSFGRGAIQAETRISPWHNNVAALVRSTGHLIPK